MMSTNKLPKGKTGGYLALSITSIVWGTTWVSSKIGVSQMPAFQMAAIRQLLAGICFVGFFIFYKKMPLPTLKQFGYLLIMAILMFVFANGLSTWSLKYIPTGLSALIGALYPLCVVLLESIFYKNHNINLLTITGLLIGLAGIGIVFYENAFHNHPDGFMLGVFLSSMAMLSWSVGSVVIARSDVTINPYYGIGWQMLISAFILFTIAYTTQPVIPLQDVSAVAWLAIGYLVAAGSLLSFVAFIYSLKHLPAAISSLYAYFNPLVAMIAAAIVVDEKLTMNILWGALVTLAGVFLVNLSIKRNAAKVLMESE